MFLVLLLAFPLIASAFPARSRLSGISRQHRRARPDAAHRLCRSDFARPRRTDCGRRVHGGHPVRELNAPFWVTLPAAELVGALLGVIFGLPSLRLRGLYLAVSTLALHFMVIYAGGEYESRRGFSTGIVIDPPSSAPS